jgi:DNA-directed RNA polymerase subunit K/omega
MADIKQKAQGMYASAQPRNISELIKNTKNIYESLCIISKRATQISVQMKRELHAKLEEFASTTENLEEIHENKEQIEISKFYERLPNPVIIATNEFLEDSLYYRYRDEK